MQYLLYATHEINRILINNCYVELLLMRTSFSGQV